MARLKAFKKGLFNKNQISRIGWRLFMLNLLLLFMVKSFPAYQGGNFGELLDQVYMFDSRQVIQETNAARAAQGLAPLNASLELDRAAYSKMQDMIAKGYFAHVSPTNVTPWYWIERDGYRYTFAGENLALGFSTAKDTVTGWLNSPSHRANVLNPKYKDIGVAVGKAEIQNIKGVVVVQMFGTPSPTVAGATPVPSKISAATPRPATPTPKKLGANAQTTPSVFPVLAVKDQPISTDPSIKSTNEATVTEKQSSGPGVRNIFNKFDKFLSWYVLAIGLISLFAYIVSREKQKSLWPSLAHIGLFLIALLIPMMEVASKSFVF